MFGLGHPELIVVGLDMATAANLLNTVGAGTKRGDQLIPGMELAIDEWPGHTVIPEDVPNPGEIVFEAIRFYQRPAEVSVPALQLAHCDSQPLYPWDDDYPRPEMHPRPGTWRA